MHYNTTAIEKSYANVAWLYDIWSSLTESKALRQSLEFASVGNGESVLEVAVGTGKNFEHILIANPDGRNEGLDISDAMLTKARKRLRKYHNYHLVHGDAAALPYEDQSFDVLINSFMLDLLPREDYPALLQEFKRVLKPAGRLIITTMAHGRKWYSRIWDVIARKFPAILTGCRPVDPETAIRSAGFTVDNRAYVVQNTFPALVLHAVRNPE
jgi:ubiquinone/menaquinone biosynthesis C-methylase UbiE